MMWTDGQPLPTYMWDSYLLFTPSPYTKEDLQNYASLDSYGQFLAGWVREMLVRRYPGDRALLVAKESCAVYFVCED